MWVNVTCPRDFGIRDNIVKGLLILGCGYSGLRVAAEATDAGIPVWGTTRTTERFSAIEQTGATPLLFGESHSSIPDEIWDRVDTVVHSIGPSWATGHDITPMIQEMLEGKRLERLVYVSSTSIYGNHDGAWVTEDTVCKPGAPAGIRRLRIENELVNWAERQSFSLIRARVSGIYGSGRSVLHRISGGRYKRISELNGYSNRIHVSDLGRCLFALCMRGEDGIYNLSDGSPEYQDTVSDYAFSLLTDCEIKRLTLEEAERTLKPSHLAMIRESKRMSNEKIRLLLGESFQFPSYLEGLKAVANEDFPNG